jgi:DNA (cytosine-5)-methyltransferase 1
MKHGSLFSGIGGFDLAAEWMGWENVFHCEIAEFPRKILNHYWPNADCYEDIKKTDFTKYRGTVDIISGGFPCQPYSAAGKRLGKEDDRHLWPEMLRVIREVKPQWVVGENVRGLLNWNGGMVFHEVCSDLENIGYEVQAFIIPASGINAPHQRERLWIVANSRHSPKGKTRSSITNEGEQSSIIHTSEQIRNKSAIFNNGFCDLQRDATHTDNTGINNGMQSNGEWKENDEQWRGQSQSEHWENGINGITSDSESQRTWEQSSENRGREDGRFNDISEDGNAADSSNERLQRSKNNRSIGKCREDSDKQFARCIQSNWQNFPTQSPVCGGDDGISHELDNITFPKWRNESIKGYGNAVVPQVVYRIFKTIEYIKNLK